MTLCCREHGDSHELPNSMYVEQAAAYLGVGTDTVREWVKCGWLKTRTTPYGEQEITKRSVLEMEKKRRRK